MSALTEAEARQQDCPFIRYCVNEVDVIQDGRAPMYAQASCQASACKMAWRWIDDVEQQTGTMDQRRNPVPPDDGRWQFFFVYRGALPVFQRTVNVRGYCGACGKP